MPLSTTSHNAFDLDTYLADRRDLVESMLDRLLPVKEPEVLFDSMRYSVLSSGKRLRALLVIASYETMINYVSNGLASPASDAIEPVLPLACAIEMIHAMSLIHDDLPCLDNDDTRRGKPTNHKVFGEAIALLAGDALLMRAIEVLICSTHIEGRSAASGGSFREPLSGGGEGTEGDGTDLIRSAPARSEPPLIRSRSAALPETNSIAHEAILEIVRGMVSAAGPDGMVGGQVLDLEYTNSEQAVDEKTVREIHQKKTGALIKFSLWSGARLALAANARDENASADEAQLSAMKRFGEIMGLAFQITDDLLDVVGSKETLGKTPGKDQAANKATWISVFGVDGAREKLIALENEGKLLLRRARLVTDEWPILESLLELAIYRQK